MTARWSDIPAAEKKDLIELEMSLVISRSSRWPWKWVGQLTCCFRSYMWGFHWLCWCFHLSYLDVSWNLQIYTNCHAVKLRSLVNLENSSKNCHVPFWSLCRQTTKPLNELLLIRAEIASNVLNDGRGWISVFNWSDTSMPTPPPVRWYAQGSLTLLTLNSWAHLHPHRWIPGGGGLGLGGVGQK